jgi:hypothetical protein
MMMQNGPDGGWRRVAGAAVAALTLWLAQAGPALAHGGTIRWDGDPAHLVEDLLVEFGMPLLVLVLGALAGVLLSRWLSRGQPDDEEAAALAAEGDEPLPVAGDGLGREARGDSRGRNASR